MLYGIIRKGSWLDVRDEDKLTVVDETNNLHSTTQYLFFFIFVDMYTLLPASFIQY